VVLAQRKRGRNQREAERGEQYEAEQASHLLALSVDLFIFYGKRIVRYWDKFRIVAAVKA
jgi:hypothetical protein